MLEYYTKFASDLISNLNSQDGLWGMNLLVFSVFLYVEIFSNLTAGLFEDLMYKRMKKREVPSRLYAGTFVYLIAIPVLFLLQFLVLDAQIRFYVPQNLKQLWHAKYHITGYQKVDIYSPLTS